MSRKRRVKKRSVFIVCVASLAFSCNEQSISPPSGNEQPQTSFTGIGDSCQLSCEIVSNTTPLRVAGVPTDSVKHDIQLATFAVSGSTGSSVSLSVDFDSTSLWTTLRSLPGVVVTTDGTSTTYPFSKLRMGANVFRFDRQRTVTIQYAFPRATASMPVASLTLTQTLDTKSKIVSARRPWAATSLANNAANGLLPVIEPGTYLGVSIAFSTWAVGDPFPDFQSNPGTGESSPIRIDFAVPVKNVGIYIEDADFPGNTITAYLASGATVTENFEYDNTPNALTRTGIGIFQKGITAILLTPAPGDYVTYDTLTFQLDNGLNVSCTPQPITREATITCNATTDDASATLAVTAWSFTDKAGNRVDREVNKTNKAWPGAVVTGGVVQVSGTVNGIAASASASFQVDPRSWADKKTEKDHLIVTPSTLPEKPLADSSLGVTAHGSRDDTKWLKAISDEGPNESFFYLTGLPMVTITRPEVNTNALNTTGPFYKLQPGKDTYDKKLQVTFCGKPWVTNIIPMVAAHEGAVPDPDNYPNSHAGIFRRHVDSVAYLRFEPLVGYQDLRVAPVSLAIQTEAYADSKAMDHDGRNTEKLPCVFHYFKP